MDTLCNSLTRMEKLMLAGAVFTACLILYVDFTFAYAGDKMWLLFVAQRMLEGKKLYVDIVEVNPPLICWIFALPVYLSLHMGGMEAYRYLALSGFLTLALVIYVSLRLMRFHPEFALNRKKQGAFCLLLVTVFLAFTYPLYFFDREYIFLVLAFPYLLRWLPAVRGTKIPPGLRIAVGIMAGIGFSIKPHCAVVFLCVQFLYVLKERSLAIVWSIENILIYSVASVYLSSVWLFTPEYIHTILPIEMATYGAKNLRAYGWIFALMPLMNLGIVFADFRRRHHSPYRQDILYLLALCLGFAAYALLNNGWGYTWAPLTSMASILTGFMLWHYSYLKKQYPGQGLSCLQFLFGMRACLIAFLATAVISLAAVHYTLAAHCWENFSCKEHKAFLEEVSAVNEEKKFASFGTISIDFDMWPYLSRGTGAAWVTRFNNVWMLPEFFASGPDFLEKNRWILDYVGSAYADDLRHNKPEIMFVGDTQEYYSVHKPVDLVRYLSAVTSFQEEWRHYRYEGRVAAVDGITASSHDGYYIYRRGD